QGSAQPASPARCVPDARVAVSTTGDERRVRRRLLVAVRSTNGGGGPNSRLLESFRPSLVVLSATRTAEIGGEVGDEPEVRAGGYGSSRSPVPAGGGNGGGPRF